MKNLIQDTLNRIKKEHIAPEPRWKFLLRKIGSWLLVVFVMALGAIAISVVYYLLAQLDWDLYRFMHQGAFIYALSMLPYLWLALLGVFVIAAFWGVRETDSGYRFNWLKIISLILVVIFITGFIMARVGLGNRFNRVMMRGVPFYAQNIKTKEAQWMQPEKGFLAGAITAKSGNIIILEDLLGTRWEVEVNAKTFIRPSADVSAGQMIKIIGAKKADKNFEAREIRPWFGRDMMGIEEDRGAVCGLEENDTCGNHRRGMMKGR